MKVRLLGTTFILLFLLYVWVFLNDSRSDTSIKQKISLLDVTHIESSPIDVKENSTDQIEEITKIESFDRSMGIISIDKIIFKNATLFLPFLFDKTDNFIIENKMLFSLINTIDNDDVSMLSRLSNGFSSEPGRYFTNQIGLLHVDSICDSASCIIALDGDYIGEPPCETVISTIDSIYQCEHYYFNNALTDLKTIWILVVHFDEVEQSDAISNVEFINFDSLFAPSALEDILSLQVNTRIATSKINKKALVSLSNIYCTELNCEIHVENGFFGVERNNDVFAKLQLNLSDICTLMNGDVDYLGGSESRWVCKF